MTGGPNVLAIRCHGRNRNPATRTRCFAGLPTGSIMNCISGAMASPHPIRNVIRDGTKIALRPLYAYFTRPNTMTSTRRFSARPSSVLLLAIGIDSPAPTGTILLASTPAPAR